MFKNFLSLLLIGTVSTVVLPNSFNQFNNSLSKIEVDNSSLDIEIDTNEFIIQDTVMIANPGRAQIKIEKYNVNVGKINPFQLKYVSRLGDGTHFVQAMDKKISKNFNPYAILNFSQLTQVTSSDEITKDMIQQNSTGVSELKIENKNNWANVKIITAIFFSNQESITDENQEVNQDTTFTFIIMSVVDSTILMPNFVEMRGSFGQKVNFYN